MTADSPGPQSSNQVPATTSGIGDNVAPDPSLAGPGGFDLSSVMQMAQSMQEQVAQAQEQLGQAQVVGSAGGGVVTVTLNGHLHLTAVHIDPKAVDPDDPSMIEDLILAAWQDAHDQVAVLQAQADPMSGLLGSGGGSDPLGGLGGLFGGV